MSAADVPYTHLVVRSGNTVQSQTGSRGTAASLGRDHTAPAPLCRGVIETTGKMVVAGALSSVDGARGDPSRLQRHKRPRGPMAPDQTTAGGLPPTGAATTEIPDITGDAKYAHRLDYDHWRARTRIGLVVLWTAMGMQMHRELTPMIERQVAQSCAVSVVRLRPA
jgi:hypothetical protein